MGSVLLIAHAERSGVEHDTGEKKKGGMRYRHLKLFSILVRGFFDDNDDILEDVTTRATHLWCCLLFTLCF